MLASPVETPASRATSVRLTVRLPCRPPAPAWFFDVIDCLPTEASGPCPLKRFMPAYQPQTDGGLSLSSVELVKVAKRFGDVEVLHGVSMAAESGEFLVLLGPSGCGKSTSLRIMAGLEKADDGDVNIAGTRVNDIPASRRRTAMVFQNYALYPHLSVSENIIFG